MVYAVCINLQRQTVAFCIRNSPCLLVYSFILLRTNASHAFPAAIFAGLYSLYKPEELIKALGDTFALSSAPPRPAGASPGTSGRKRVADLEHSRAIGTSLAILESISRNESPRQGSSQVEVFGNFTQKIRDLAGNVTRFTCKSSSSRMPRRQAPHWSRATTVSRPTVNERTSTTWPSNRPTALPV